MPIRVSCACGKSLTVKDELAGKAVKCPGCQQVVRIPAAGQPARPAAARSKSARPAAAGSKAARSSAARPAATPASSDLDDLFDEAGLRATSGPTCPACAAELKPGAVLCTNCGTNLQTGQRLTGYQQAKVEAVGHGNLQLDKAVADMKDHEAMNSRTLNAGMPGWFLAIMLVFVCFFTFAAVSIVNAAAAGDEATGLAKALKGYAADSSIVWGCIISGLVLQGIARIWLTVVGFMDSLGNGLVTLFMWHKFLGQLSEHPVVGLVYALGLFTTLSGLGLIVVDWMA